MTLILESNKTAPLKFLMIISEATLSDICTMAAPSLLVRNFTYEEQDNKVIVHTVSSPTLEIFFGVGGGNYRQEFYVQKLADPQKWNNSLSCEVKSAK